MKTQCKLYRKDRRRLLHVIGLSALMFCTVLSCGCGEVDDTAAQTQIIKSEGYIVVPENLTSLGYEYVGMYAEPDAGSPLVLQLYEDTAIDIFDVRGQWYYAGVNEKRGYVQAENVTLVPPEEREPIYTQSPSETTTQAVTTAATVPTTAATQPPVTETDPPEDEGEETAETTTTAEVVETSPGENIPGVPPVSIRPAPSFNDIYIYNSAPANADGQCFTLHTGGTFDYWIAEIVVHSPDAAQTMRFQARDTRIDTPLASGSCYDYVTVSIVPYYNDGASGNTTTVRYDVIQG